MEKTKWVLMPKMLTPSVDPGQSIEAELFLTGTGKVFANKLYINYPTAIINKKNAGEIISSIAVAKLKDTGKIFTPVSGRKYLQTHSCNPIGVTISLNEGYFLDIPNQLQTNDKLPRKMSESKWDDYPPLLLKLNTDKKAPSGDYNIGLAFTYTTEDEVDINKETMNIHITSWTDRHGRTSIIIGIAVGYSLRCCWNSNSITEVVYRV